MLEGTLALAGLGFLLSLLQSPRYLCAFGSYTRKSQQGASQGLGWGEVSHSLEAGIPRPLWLHFGGPCVRGERQAGPVSPCGPGPGPHSLACPSHLNCADLSSPGFSIHRLGQAPADLQPLFLWEDSESDSTPCGGVGQAEGLHNATVFIYLFSMGVVSGLSHPTSLP